jgi:hypothetical protein
MVGPMMRDDAPRLHDPTKTSAKAAKLAEEAYFAAKKSVEAECANRQIAPGVQAPREIATPTVPGRNIVTRNERRARQTACCSLHR